MHALVAEQVLGLTRGKGEARSECVGGGEGEGEGAREERGGGLTYLAQELSTEHGYARSPVSHLIVLGLGDVNEDFGCGVIDMHGFEDRSPVVGHLIGGREGGKVGRKEGEREGGREGE